MAGVLEGITVVDFGHYIAGPLAAVLLADHGADVIRVDRPGTGADEHPRAAFLHRGKRRITLDLKQPADLDIARRLVDRADVLIENFRPGVMDRLGLGPSTVRATNPGLVYCSLPGFAADDPRAAMPAWEGVLAAATGNCHPRRGEGPEGWDESRPVYSAIPLASNFAAYLAGTAIVAALTERHRTGRGRHVEVPLFHAVFELIGAAGTYVTERGMPPPKVLSTLGSGTHRCADGRYVQFNPIGGSMRFMTWFLDAAGKSEWVAEGLTSPKKLAADPELGHELNRRIKKLFLERTAQEWEELGNAAGVPICQVRTTREWTRTGHARASQAVVRLDDPVLGPTWMTGRPLRMSTQDAPLRPRHLPDADRADILAELDEPAPPRPVAAEPPDGLPYTGMRVVDLTQILAGPTAGRLIGELGADVVKINAPQRRVDAHGVVNRGKRTILVDVESERGREEILWPLVRTANVLTQNFPHGTVERYGIGYEHARGERKDLVYISVSCYGKGPWESYRGYETQGQAVTGVLERASRGSRAGLLGPYNVIDFGTGTVAALGAALGLYHQVVRGEGQHVSTSLAQVGTLHQATLLIEPESGPVLEGEPAGRWTLGPSPLQRFYRAADGWFFLGATADDLPALAEVDGLAAIRGLAADDDRLTTAIEQCVTSATAAEWVERLTAAGVGAHRVVAIADLMEDPDVRSRGLSISQVTDEVGEVTMPGPAITLDNRPLRPGPPARRPGSDATDVLTELGLDKEAIDRLGRAWVVQLADLPPGWA